MSAEQQISFNAINPQCSCFNLRKASRAVTQYYDHQLEKVGIRSTQFTLLISMASVKARTLTEMANSLVMDRTTLTRNLKPLEKAGFIESAGSRDKRSKAYALTFKGREVLERGVPLWMDAQQKIVSQLGDERYQHLLSELDAVTKIISKL